MDGLPTRESRIPGVVVMPGSAAEVREIVRLLHLTGDAVRRPGRRHRALRRRGGRPGRGAHRPDPDEPDPRGGSGPPAGDASAGRRERPALRGRRRRTGSTTCPIPPARPPAPWAATWRRTPAGRTASSTASPPITWWSSRSCCPTLRSSGSARSQGEPWGPDLVGLFVGSEGMFGIATEIVVRLEPIPASVRTMLADFSTVRSGERGRLRDHRRRHRARRAGDDGPGVRAGGGGLDLRGGLSHRRGGGAAGGARRRSRCRRRRRRAR